MAEKKDYWDWTKVERMDNSQAELKAHKTAETKAAEKVERRDY